MKRLDLNVDIGEGFGFDRQLLHFATSANVCAGEHAGSWELTMETIHLCLEAGVRIGMHPGYPDREGMGRNSMRTGQVEAYAESVARQVERFYFFVPAAYMKPHGALYNDAAGESEAGFLARTMIEDACRRFQLPLMGLPGTAMETIAPSGFIREGFADRAYLPNGRLMQRTEPGAILASESEVRRQTLFLAERVDSICLHGDTPGCVAFAEKVYATLVDAGFEVGV